MNREIFREYDVRGLVETDLTPGLVEKLGRAVGTYAASHAVTTMTLGRDCRLSSGALGEAMKRGLLSTGLDVIDIGTCATPILYFSVRHLKTGGGVMVTGSHNPPEFNGFKICVGPDTIYGSEIQKLREIIEGGAFRSGSGRAESRRHLQGLSRLHLREREGAPRTPGCPRWRKRRGGLLRQAPLRALRL